MTIEEFDEHNRLKNMPKSNNGLGYKLLDWENSPDDIIIYIPETAYEDGAVKRENAFTKQDIINLVQKWVKENNLKVTQKDIEAGSQLVFELVEGQFPQEILYRRR